MKPLAMQEDARMPWRWLRPLAVCSVVALVLLGHWPSATRLHVLWLDADGSSSSYTHGYLLAALSLWLLWRNRGRLDNVRLNPVPWALFLLCGAELLWLFSYQSGIDVVCLTLLPVLSWLVLLATLGWRAAQICLLPLAYPYFATPAWGLLNPLAQWGTVYAVRPLLQLVGVNAYFDGNIVQIPSGSFEIAGGCSGLNYIMVGLAIGTLTGELRGDGIRMRLRLLALALGLAVLANWVRVTAIILVGDLTHMQHYLVTTSHLGFGWAVFGVAMIMFFAVERRWPVEARRATIVSRTTTATEWRSLAATWAAALVLVMSPLTISGWISQGATAIQPELPELRGAWVGPELAENSSWQPKFLNADQTAMGTYRREGAEVEVYGAWYVVQRQGKELAGYENSIIGSHSFARDQTIVVLDGKPFVLANVEDSDGQMWAMVYSYSVGEQWFANPLRAQVGYGVQALRRLKPPVSRVLAARVRCVSDCLVASETAHLLLQHLLVAR